MSFSKTAQITVEIILIVTRFFYFLEVGLNCADYSWWIRHPHTEQKIDFYNTSHYYIKEKEF